MSIKSYIQGKRIVHTYEIKEHKDEDTGKFKRKPELVTHDNITWETLQKASGAEFIVDGDIGQSSYNQLFMYDLSHRINLSETEEVCVTGKIYRADLHAYMVHTDKVLSEEDAAGSEDMKHRYDVLVSEYNMQMIADDEKLAAYCGVHNLNPATTDYEELKKIVYGKEPKYYVSNRDMMFKADYIKG